MILTYWEGDTNELNDFTMAWSQVDPDVRIYTQHHVAELIKDVFERSLFERLQIRTARADIARFVLLREHGGFYAAPGTVPGNLAATRMLLGHLNHSEFVVFVDHEYSDHNIPFVLDFAVLSQPECYLPHLILNSIFTNLATHDRMEAKSPESLSYRLERITGRIPVAARLFVKTLEDFDIAPYIKGKIHIEPASRVTGHSGFSAIGTMVDHTLKDRAEGSPNPGPLLAHPRWENDTVRRIFNRATLPTNPKALHWWRGAREKILLTGPVEEQDIKLLNDLTRSMDMLAFATMPRQSSHSHNDVMVEIGYWEGSYESILDEYLLTLASRALQYC